MNSPETKFWVLGRSLQTTEYVPCPVAIAGPLRYSPQDKQGFSRLRTQQGKLILALDDREAFITTTSYDQPQIHISQAKHNKSFPKPHAHTEIKRPLLSWLSNLTISGASPVEVWYMAIHVRMRSSARIRCQGGAPNRVPRARVPGRKQTRWSWKGRER